MRSVDELRYARSNYETIDLDSQASSATSQSLLVFRGGIYQQVQILEHHSKTLGYVDTQQWGHVVADTRRKLEISCYVIATQIRLPPSAKISTKHCAFLKE